MHIPSSMLNGAICPVTLTVGAVGLGLAGYWSGKIKEKPGVFKFAGITALIFALQMLNYPIQDGTSGHLVGAMLAVSFLGIPFAVVSMALILAVQAFFFGDGGINALGVNILNMGILGAALSGFLFYRMIQKGMNRSLALGLAAWFSVLIGAVACAFEVAFSGAASLEKVLPAMLSVHSLIGLGEGVLTVAIVAVLGSCVRFWKENSKALAVGSLGLAAVATTLSPFASNFPDGLEWVAEKFSFVQFSAVEFPALFPGYQATFIGHAGLSSVVAGFIGIAIIFILTSATNLFLPKEK
ncbi:MAG: energy-coupling factor ABC transporter permease [Candidatus Omnitrophota bacterium]